MHTDMPHAAMWEADPMPPREHLLYISGLPAGSRIGDIVPRLEKAGLGRARVHFRSSGTQVRVQLGSGPQSRQLPAVAPGSQPSCQGVAHAQGLYKPWPSNCQWVSLPCSGQQLPLSKTGHVDCMLL